MGIIFSIVEFGNRFAHQRSFRLTPVLPESMMQCDDVGALILVHWQLKTRPQRKQLRLNDDLKVETH